MSEYYDTNMLMKQVLISRFKNKIFLLNSDTLFLRQVEQFLVQTLLADVASHLSSVSLTTATVTGDTDNRTSSLPSSLSLLIEKLQQLCCQATGMMPNNTVSSECLYCKVVSS